MLLTIAVAVTLTILLLLVGALTTNVGDWYRDLRKPGWTPPNWVFAPAWTLILALACGSGVLGWSMSAPETRWRVVMTFGANMALHLLWSPLFFRLRRPDLALVDVAALWASIVAMILVVQSASPLAGWLLAPYLIWVSYAAALNLAIIRLNSRAAVVNRDAAA